MKKLYTRFLMLAMVAIVVASCEKAPVVENGWSEPLVGEVLVVEQPLTRVSFEDEGVEGLAASWEVDDVFTLYDAEGARVDNFKCSSIESTALFVSMNTATKLTNGAAYTAIYPASAEATINGAKAAINPMRQNGDEINDLDNSLYMLADFTYSVESNSIVFEHQMAVMTFKFKSDVTPDELLFENGTEKYIVSFTNIKPDADDIYTSHIMINPCEAATRILSFRLSKDQYLLYTRKTSSKKAYEAGVRYTASVSNFTENIFSGGDGSMQNPYQISSDYDLRKLSDMISGNNGYMVNPFEGERFILTEDINLGGEDFPFTPIGRSIYPFKGIFDGNGHTISGLYINESDKYETHLGLFGYIWHAKIKNLTVAGNVNSTFDDSASIGGIVGYSDRSTVANCNNSVTMIGGSSATIGGIVGWNCDTSWIVNCSNNATVTGGNHATVGGLVGYCYAGEVINCYNRAELTGGDYGFVGGIAGCTGNRYDSPVINCYNSAKLNGGVSTLVGGIVGRSDGAAVSFSYYDSLQYDGNAVGGGYAVEDTVNCVGMSTNEMQSSNFVDILNNGAYTYNQNQTYPDVEACSWVLGDDYPVLDIDNFETVFK